MATENLHIIDLISSIVDNIRIENNIILSTDNLNGTYTIATDNVDLLSANDFIEINGVQNILVTSVNTLLKTFEFSHPPGTVFSGKWKANKPYFHYEKYTGAANILIEKKKSILNKYQQYPFIFLLLDIPENRDPELANYSEIPNITLLFVTQTDPAKKADWRHNNTFKNILRPLYQRFIIELNDSFYIAKKRTDLIKHTYTEHFFLGSESPNQNQFNEYIDAIEINISNLKIKNLKNC